LVDLNLDDNLWHLQLYDENGVAVVKFYYSECKKDFGGQIGEHSKAIIHNLFNNFRVSHVVSTIHAKAWYRRKGVNYEDHPHDKSGKAMVLTTANHRARVEEGVSIMRSVNDSVSSGGGHSCLLVT
jgi:hypothetical protein